MRNTEIKAKVEALVGRLQTANCQDRGEFNALVMDIADELSFELDHEVLGVPWASETEVGFANVVAYILGRVREDMRDPAEMAEALQHVGQMADHWNW